MININKGHISISGNSVVILAETEELLRHVRLTLERHYGVDEAKDIMKEVFDNSFMSEEERVEDVDDTVKGLNNILNKLKKDKVEDSFGDDFRAFLKSLIEEDEDE